MKFNKKFLLFSKYTILLLILLFSCQLSAQDTRFVVVLDAGHGGHDPGAMGYMSREKDINLAMVLNLGSIIERNFKDVKVIYTRKTDVYLTLQERADVVNNNHADLFICMHTNSSKSSAAYGAESYTLGLAKSKANLDVAMRENSVILMEEDYKTKYKGFDPTSVESYIMFEFMQDKYIDKSVEFSSNIQKQFVSYSHRSDRGVRQAGFWVLHRSACPSVLVEVGFISNPDEERFLNSEKGQDEMCTAIYNAFVNYKRNHDKMSGKQTSNHQPREIAVSKPDTNKQAVVQKTDTALPIKNLKSQKEDIAQPTANSKTQNTSSSSSNKNETVASNQVPIFKVQVLASEKKLNDNNSNFKGLHNLDYFVEGGFYKYTIGAETDYKKILQIRSEIVSKFPKSFIIAFVGDKKMTAKEALKLIK
ncbi:MAG: N-acetylmuramoyl-L-alanine amidase [Paludibacter sp.]